MHFAKESLVWECSQQFGSEASPYGFPVSNEDAEFDEYGPSPFKVCVRRFQEGSKSTKLVTGTGRTLVIPSNSTRPRFYKLWGELRDAYSQCAMTRQEDCLVALSGIAHNVGKVMNEQLVAGIWKGNMLEEICWRCYNPTNATLPSGSLRPTDWRVPTWSWASSILAIQRTRLAMGPKTSR
jgi:hypothetical protein